MPKILRDQLYTILAAGATKSFSVTEEVDIYRLTANGGAVTLLADMIFNSTGTPSKGHLFKFVYSGGVTLNGNALTVFGTDLTTAQALYRQIIEAYYNGTTWEVTIIKDVTDGNRDLDGDDIVATTISTTKLEDDAVTRAKIANFAARGYLMRGGVAGAVEDFNAVTSGQLVMGNGTDVVSQAMSGDVTISGSGVTTIGAGKVTEAMLAFTLADQLLEASLTIATASILTLNGTPITIIAAPGSGKYIEVVSATCTMTYVSAAYATNTTLQLICEGAGTAQKQNTGALINTAAGTSVTNFVDSAAKAAGATQIIPNTALQVKVATGNPTTGDSGIIVKVLYRIVTI